MILSSLSSDSHRCHSPKPITSKPDSRPARVALHRAPKTDTRRIQNCLCTWRGRSHRSCETSSRRPQAMKSLNWWRHYHSQISQKRKLCGSVCFRRKFSEEEICISFWVKWHLSSKLSELEVKIFRWPSLRRHHGSIIDFIFNFPGKSLREGFDYKWRKVVFLYFLSVFFSGKHR